MKLWRLSCNGNIKVGRQPMSPAFGIICIEESFPSSEFVRSTSSNWGAKRTQSAEPISQPRNTWLQQVSPQTSGFYPRDTYNQSLYNSQTQFQDMSLEMAPTTGNRQKSHTLVLEGVNLEVVRVLYLQQGYNLTYLENPLTRAIII